MEASPWLSPSFLLPAITTAVLLIVLFTRQEAKTNATAARQKEHEADMVTREAAIIKRVDELKDEHREVKKAFYNHAADTKVHHNEEMFKEFRTGLERRFNNMETTLGDIKTLIVSRNKVRDDG